MDQATREAAIKIFLARREIVDAWVSRVLSDDAIPSARRVAEVQLRGYVPRFLDSAIDALRDNAYQGDVRERAVDVGRVHVNGRIDAGFALEEVLRVIGHFQATLFEHLPDGGNAETILGDVLADARALAEDAYARRDAAR